MRERGCMSMPKHLNFDRRHIAAIKPNHVNKSNRWERGFYFLHVERVIISIITHDIARMPVPAVAPKIQGIMISRVVGFSPCNEINQRLWVTKVSFVPICNGVFRGRCHSLGNMEKFGSLPVSITG